jgi:sialate O-acetylesterase
MKRLIFLVAPLLLFAPIYAGDFQMPKIFSSNMVLQRDMFIPVWGKAEPGSEINIEFAGGATSAVAKSSGDWKALLPEVSAGGPYEMKVSTKDTTAVFSNVMLGDVWLASGQSNMQWQVNNSNNADQEIANANYPNIRLFTAPRNVSGVPKWDITGGEWLECSPQTVAEFSAVAYFFGRELYQEIDIPIGLLHTSWGGTPAEAWTSADMLKNIADYRDAAERILIEHPDYELLAEAQKPLDALYNKLITETNEGVKIGVHERKFKDSNWKTRLRWFCLVSKNHRAARGHCRQKSRGAFGQDSTE